MRSCHLYQLTFQFQEHLHKHIGILAKSSMRRAVPYDCCSGVEKCVQACIVYRILSLSNVYLLFLLYVTTSHPLI